MLKAKSLLNTERIAALALPSSSQIQSRSLSPVRIGSMRPLRHEVMVMPRCAENMRYAEPWWRKILVVSGGVDGL
jgi:hypothetical protein